jgi:hypothetical protein
VVYFIHDGERNAVKIGWSDEPEKRLKTFMAANPGSLILLATIEGGACEERQLHRHFDHLRVEGRREWFHCTAELLNCINDLSGNKLWEETLFLSDDDCFYIPDEYFPTF